VILLQSAHGQPLLARTPERWWRQGHRVWCSWIFPFFELGEGYTPPITWMNVKTKRIKNGQFVSERKQRGERNLVTWDAETAGELNAETESWQRRGCQNGNAADYHDRGYHKYIYLSRKSCKAFRTRWLGVVGSMGQKVTKDKRRNWKLENRKWGEMWTVRAANRLAQAERRSGINTESTEVKQHRVHRGKPGESKVKIPTR